MVFVLPKICSCVSDFLLSNYDQSLFVNDFEETESYNMESEVKEEKHRLEGKFALLDILTSLSDSQRRIRYFTCKNTLSRGRLDTLNS
jgi:hypothetical protein